MRTANLLETRLLIVAVVCVCAALALGAFVSSRTPTRIDVEATALRGTALPLALFFTSLGRWPVLLVLAAVAAAGAAATRSNVVLVAIVFAAQVVSQGANALVKLLFHRARPDSWLLIRETDFSYPSGHAVTAVVFFVGFAILVWHAPLPRPAAFALVGVLTVCAVGIPWSRIALGAHYLTDVIGGLFVGAAFLSLALIAILRTAPTALR
ncbi:MAG: phosphatase PAP2 family protein [Candidatus Elarobacter sp.]